MDASASNTTLAEIARRIHAARRIALVTHERPDGDALGSQLALARAAPALGKTADVYVMGPLEPALETVIRSTPIHRVEDQAPGDDYDLIIVVDTGVWQQLEPLTEWLGRHHEKTVVIDHHPHGDEVGALRLVEPSAAAAAEMVLALLEAVGYELESAPGGAGVAEALFVGIATDTGWFRYANAGPHTLRVAARLLDLGVDKSVLYELIEETHRPERLALEARALASVEYVAGGAVAIQSLRRRDFDETRGTISDLAGMVNRPMSVAGVRVAILLAETVPGVTKISLRAKEPGGGDERLAMLSDVNRLARMLGGGGHTLAAGARLNTGIDEARRTVLDVLV